MLSSVVSSPIQKPLRLRRVNHSDEIVSGFSKLFKNESMTDVTLICNGGQTIRAHRVILSLFSPYFKAIFESQPFTNNQCQYPVIVIKDLAYTELRTIIEFIYKGEVSVSRDKLSSVLQAAKALEVSGLSELKVESFINSSNLDQNNGNDGNSFNDPDLSLASLNGSLGSLRSSLNIGITNENNGNNWKRGHDNVDNLGSSGIDSSIKKSRIILETGLENDQGISILGDNKLDGVKSLLQQPSRLSQGLQGLRSNSLGFNQLLLNKQSSRHITVEQFLQQQQFQQRQQMLEQKLRAQQQQFKNQILQQQLLSKSSSSKSRSNGSPQESNFLQFQEKIKAQILEKQKIGSNQSSLIQEKLLQRQGNLKKSLKAEDKLETSEKNKKSISDEEVVDTEDGEHNGADVSYGHEHADQTENEELSNKEEENDSKSEEKSGETKSEEESKEKNDNLNDEHDLEKVKNSKEEEKMDQEEIKDLSMKDLKQDESTKEKSKVKNGPSGDEEDDDSKKLEIDQSGNDAEDLSGYVNGEDLNEEEEEEEEFEVEIGKDLIFQRQQQLRLQQLQKQQQYQQIQFQQDQQEQKLLEIHRKLQQVNNAGVLPTEPDDPSANLSLDWQEGFVDDSFPNLSTLNDNLLKNQERSLSILIQAQNNGNNHREFGNNHNNTSSNTNLTTPDFLQPRGPGRPRKGNKTQDISPCPECNKVFVRPDVLKLHYRSVHLNERHPCNMCPKIFKWPGDLSKHKRTKHKEACLSVNANKNQPINVSNS